MPAKGSVTNAAGLTRTLRALKSRLGPDDEALVALAKGLAAAVDADTGNAALWREYRAAVTALMEAGSDRGVDDDTQAFLLAIRTPGVRPKVGDTATS